MSSFHTNRRKKFFALKAHNFSKKVSSFDRIKILYASFLVFSFIVVFRLFDIQILNHRFYEALASGQHELYEKLFPQRGKIFLKDPFASDNRYTIAANMDLYVVYANPGQVKNPEEDAKSLSPLLGISSDEILPRLSKKDDLYEPLKRRVSEEELDEIKKLNIAGIGWTKESWRFYPEQQYTSHLTGFLGLHDDEQKGQYGIEGRFDAELRGVPGFIQSERDAMGRLLAFGENVLEDAKDGSNIALTVDKNIQFFVCDKLNEAVQRHGADRGAVVVMNPWTGEILSMCSNPDYDANYYSDVSDIEVFKNLGVSDAYEPGSVFKPITLAGALDMGKINPNSTYTDEGFVQIGRWTIKNSDGKTHGVKTMTQVLEESLNTGAIFSARSVGEATFYQYVKNFGFGTEAGLEIQGEASGDISNLDDLKEINMATGSYGQGITTTLLQLAQAYAVIANGGNLVKPYMVDSMIDASGQESRKSPVLIRRVISEKAATLLSAMLVSVVDNGHGKRAGIPGYFVAGKTGTAQVPYKDRAGYDPGKHIGSFVGFAPASDPRFVIAVRMDDPKDVDWAESSAAPLFGEIAKFLVDYFQIPPDRQP